MTGSPSYEAVIGLEVHARMLSESKAFCGCGTDVGQPPNTNVCPVCLGLPGALPVLNRRLVESVVKMGLSTNCTVAPRTLFARKNYFYPDLPKGYQISQYEEPICTNGFAEIDLGGGTRKRIGITRIHMEEDAGKSIHDSGAGTVVDLNRSGLPLIEIVSEPDLRSPHEAYLFLRKIRQIVTHLGICDGNMEEGSLRCDANVSMRPAGAVAFGTKTELKNMNSFRYVERALEYEVKRQGRLLEEGGTVAQETLLWDAHLSVALPMRSKEESHDYRYFPDPDLPPVEVGGDLLGRIGSSLGEHPTARRDRFMREFGLPQPVADVLTEERGVAEYFERTAVMAGTAEGGQARAAANWVMTEVLRVLGERHIGIDRFPVSPGRLAALLELVKEGSISSKTAKEVFAEMLDSPEQPDEIVARRGLRQISDERVIAEAARKAIAEHPVQLQKYRSGTDKVLGFFVGQVMESTGGKANPVVVNKILKQLLHK